MANSSNEIDGDRRIVDPRAIHELNQGVITEFRANQGRVTGVMLTRGQTLVIRSEMSSRRGCRSCCSR
jgi:hypothetical protein